MNWIKNRLNARDETGAVAVIVAICMVVFCGIAAFAVDMGYAYAVDRQHSVTADASALAGAQAVGLAYKEQYPGAGPGCTTVTANDVEDEAAAAVQATYDDNDVAGTGDPVVTDVTCEGGNFRVTATTSSEVDAVFGPVLGVDTMNPGAQATAIVSGSPGYGGLRPFVMCGPVVAAVVANPNGLHHSGWGGTQCTTGAPGNWGIADFDGGSNPTDDIADWTRYGYPGVVTFPNPAIPGDPGANFNSSQVKNALDAILGQTVLFPVGSTWTASGSSASFDGSGVVGVQVCGWRIKNAAANMAPCGNAAALNTFHSASSSELTIQWRYEAYTTSYQSSGATASCSLSGATCMPAIRLWRNP